MTEPTYSVAPARYSKGNFIISCPSTNDLKTRAARLVSAGLNCRYTRRERGYVASAAKVVKFKRMFDAGLDACMMTGEIYDPAKYRD